MEMDNWLDMGVIFRIGRLTLHGSLWEVLHDGIEAQPVFRVVVRSDEFSKE